MRKTLYILLGSLSLALGVTGIVLPGLPTTPFLLLSATLFLKGSARLHNWLLNHRYLGARIKRYHQHKGMLKQEKIYAILLTWVMIGLSMLLLAQPILRWVAAGSAILGTAVIWWWVPDGRKNASQE
ncbi:YbaN family protein [Geofilum rhodophaeum]|uniref:YbaN family protein n=1 Tax=Geofilum rhodophaeum TaxID=1965019 RepID=UPI000B528976|nr:YbaN family protein [Geofilum rhodophaeum]